LKQAERRIPPDLRRQIDRTIKDGQKRFDATVKDVRARVSKATAPSEIERALKRFGDFSKQVEGMARQLTARTQSATRATTARRTTARRSATPSRRATARRATAKKATATTRKPATRRTTTRRRATMVTPMPPAVPEAPIAPPES